MKALVYTGTEQVEYRDEPDPHPPAEGEVLIAIDACGLCGSDMHAYHGHDARRVPPLILGHEAVGVVASGDRSGERVVVNPLICCGQCMDCLNGRSNLCAKRELIGMRKAGAFAEQVVVPSSNIVGMPADLGAVEASLTEPTAVSLHAIHKAERLLDRPVSEARVCIIGAGAIGVLAALLLKHKGCGDIYLGDTNPRRRATAEKHNFGNVYDPLSSAPASAAFDLVIDAVGSGKTRAAASALARPGGVICHAGLQDDSTGLDTRRLTLQEITFVGLYTYTVADIVASLNIIHRGQLGSLDWIEQRPLAEGASAFADIHTGRSAAPKIVFIP